MARLAECLKASTIVQPVKDSDDDVALRKRELCRLKPIPRIQRRIDVPRGHRTKDLVDNLLESRIGVMNFF